MIVGTEGILGISETAKAKREIIDRLHANKGSLPCSDILKLAELEIQACREANDTITPELLRYNQGRLSAWLDIRDRINNGYPHMPT